MQIRQLRINNFRGVGNLDWTPEISFCCLIGPGDSCKSTVLDAIEACLSSRWFSFSEADFFGGDTSKSISIEITVGELSKSLKSDERFGLYIRGWTKAGALRDEPEEDDEPVLTVRLSVDATLEPVWELICDRIEYPRTISNRDRLLFGLVRLNGEDARHLAWGQGSVLSKLTGDSGEAASRLAEAYKAARDSAKLHEIEALAKAASAAQEFAKGMGAYVEGDYGPGLELGRGGLSSGAIALHDAGVPLRLAGLGTRRLATLAIQKSAITDGAIILVDEIEHGLEPHRIMGAIAQLKLDQTNSVAESRPVGQVLMTTHSDVALGEVGAGALFVCRMTRPERLMYIRQPTHKDSIVPLMRFTPRALFARRVLVTEGMTEVGMLTGIRENWPPRHRGIPIEHLGSAIADGNGGQACSLALCLAGLGYTTALYRDSDVPLSQKQVDDLAAAKVPVFEYGDLLDTEHALFTIASDVQMQNFLAYARAERGDGAVNDNLLTALDLDRENIVLDFSLWELFSSLTAAELRNVTAKVFADKKWFKDQRIGRGLAPIAWDVSLANPAAPFSVAVAAAEAWLYA